MECRVVVKKYISIWYDRTDCTFYHKSYIKSRDIEYLENNKIHCCTESNDTIKDRHFTDELER